MNSVKIIVSEKALNNTLKKESIISPNEKS